MDNQPKNMSSREERFTPKISNIDANTAQVLRNAGYGDVSLPPGVTADPNLNVHGQFMAQNPGQVPGQAPANNPNIGGSQQEYLEYNQAVNLGQFQQPQFQQPQPQQGQSIVGRNSPYALVNQMSAQEAEMQQQQFMNQPNPAMYQPNPSQVQQQMQQQQPQVPQQQPEYFVNDQGKLEVYQGPPEDQGDPNVHPALQGLVNNQQATQQQTAQQQQANQAPQNQQSASSVLAALDAGQQPQQTQVPPQIPNQMQQPSTQQDPATAVELARLKAENDAIKAMMAQQTPAQQQGQQAGQTEEVSQPQLDDFTKDLGDSWNPEDALNFNTKSGKAYAKFQAARDKYLADVVTKQVSGNLQQQESDRLTLQKSAELAQAYPEFRNLDGSPNIPKIQQFFDGMLNRTNWATLKRAYDLATTPNANPVPQHGSGNVMPTQNGIPQVNQSMQQMLQQPQQQNQQFMNPNQIGQMATRVVPINNGGGPSGAQPQQVQVPQTIKDLQKIYGNNFELPTFGIVR